MREADIIAAAAPRWLEPAALALDHNGPVERPFTPFPEGGLDEPVCAHVARAAARWPDRVALRDDAGALSYARMWAAVGALAAAIAAQSDEDALIAIALPADRRAPMAMLACMAAARPFVMLDPSYPAPWRAAVLQEARPALVIAPNGFDARARVLALDALPDGLTEWHAAARNTDAPACVLFTSGSTGAPKGVVNGERALLQRAAQAIAAAHVNETDRFLTLASLATIVGVRDVLTALIAGAEARLCDPQTLSGREAGEIMVREETTILFAFPALLRTVAAARARAPESVRLVRMGGDTILWRDVDMLRGWLPAGVHVQCIYAATEAPMLQWFVDEARRGDDPRIPIGHPLPGAKLALVDPDGAPTPAGEIGEIVVESPYVMLGAWRAGRLEALPARDGARRFHTGDLARVREDGFLERVGRADRVVKIRGARVDLDGVEALLRAHPQVADVGAMARAHGGSAVLVAYVAPRAGGGDTLIAELRALMADAPAALRPARIYLTDSVPRLPSSKLDAKALAARDAACVAEEAARPSAIDRRDQVAAAVAGAWRAVLHAAPSGPEADFFSEGGDSLAAVALVMEIERALNIEAPLTLVQEAPTFAAMCAALESEARDPLLVTLKAGAGTPVFIVHGVGGGVGDLFTMARAVDHAGPVIGVQARGLVGADKPHTRIAPMAGDYLAAIRARQPEGPYLLCGYSFGGLAAFEIARLLESAGARVGFLGLFDATMSPVRWPARVWFGMAGRWLSGRWPKRTSPPAPVGPARVLRVSASSLLASARYAPGAYGGAVTLFSPRGRDPNLPPLKDVWRGRAGSLTLIEVPGDHISMMNTHAAETAAALTQALRGRT